MFLFSLQIVLSQEDVSQQLQPVFFLRGGLMSLDAIFIASQENTKSRLLCPSPLSALFFPIFINFPEEILTRSHLSTVT